MSKKIAKTTFIPCEVMVRQLLPALRAAVAKELIRKHRYTQVEVAQLLGLTQAAVSKYLAGKYSNKRFERDKKFKAIAAQIAAQIKAGGPQQKIIKLTCKACEHFLVKSCRAR